MKSLRLAALAAALVLGACSSPAPTDPAASASHPGFDGGPAMTGSGNGAGGGATTSDTGGATVTNDTTPQRGGGMLGSGN